MKLYGATCKISTAAKAHQRIYEVSGFCVIGRDRNPERDSESFVRNQLSQIAGFKSHRGPRRDRCRHLPQ